MCFACYNFLPTSDYTAQLTLNGSTHKCEVCGYRRQSKRLSVIGLLFVRVTIRNTLVSLSCSCLRVEGWLRMSNYLFFVLSG